MRRHSVHGRRRRRIARLRRGVFVLPSLLTTANIFCGFTSVIMSFQGQFQTAAILIIIAGVLDGLDGRVARLTNATSEFGGEYDSLADVVSFGIAPAFLAHAWGLGPITRYGQIVAFLFLICGAVRLARFNIQHGASDRRWFVGLPIPMAAALVAGCVLQFEKQVVDPLPSLLFAALILATSFLMVSRIRYRSFKDVGLRNRQPFRTVVTIAAALAILALHPQVLLLAIAAVYAASAPAAYLAGLMASGRRRLRGSAKEPAVETREAPSGAR